MDFEYRHRSLLEKIMITGNVRRKLLATLTKLHRIKAYLATPNLIAPHLTTPRHTTLRHTALHRNMTQRTQGRITQVITLKKMQCIYLHRRVQKQQKLRPYMKLLLSLIGRSREPGCLELVSRLQYASVESRDELRRSRRDPGSAVKLFHTNPASLQKSDKLASLQVSLAASRRPKTPD